MTKDFYRRKTGLSKGEPIPAEDVENLYKAARFVARSAMGFDQNLPRYFPLEPDSDYVKFLRTAYLSEVRKADQEVARTLDILKPTKNDIIIITSDHGEEFFEHGGFTHHNAHVYQELLHVPLIIRLPGLEHAGKVIDTPVTLVDLYPTLLELLGEPVPEDISGISLKPLIEGEKVASRPLFVEEHSETERENTVLIEYPWKIIYQNRKKKASLFNLVDDPSEKNDLKHAEPERAVRMRDDLNTWVKSAKSSWKTEKSAPLSEEEQKKLKSMGYME